MTYHRARYLAVALLVWVACTGCVDDDARKAAELHWSRPEAGAPWCEVLGNSEVGALVGAANESGLPWQKLISGEFEWSCTIAATMQGRGLDHEETPPPLVSIWSRLRDPKTPEAVAAGTYVPVGAGVTPRVVRYGHGIWASEPAGEYFVLKPCRRLDAVGSAPSEDLEVQLSVSGPDAVDAAKLRQATAAAWLEAAEYHGCRR